MILYHGTNIRFDNIDLSRSKDKRDFGKGFYVTSYPEQAEKWALRKSLRFKVGRPNVSVYELNDDLSGRNVLEFRDPEDELLSVQSSYVVEKKE